MTVHYKRARAIFIFGQGDFQAAAIELAGDAEPQNTYETYVSLFRYLARARSGDSNAAIGLKADAARIDLTNWPRPVVEVFLGERSAADVKKSAQNSNERCEAHFFVGQWQLLQRNRTAAKADLEIAAKTCPKNFDEYPAAVAELKRLAGR
jgi:lipoprotein NlpI